MNSRAVALVLGVLVAVAFARADDKPPPENGLTDPAATAFAPGSELPVDAPPVFPASAFCALGSSLVQAAGFSRLGWTQVQITAFVDGMRATFDGKPLSLGSESKESALEASRRLAAAAARARQFAGAPAPAASDFPLPAYSIFGSSMVQSGHFAELGWTDAQFDAFLSGMRAAFLEVPVPMDPAARQLAADIGRRIAVAETRSREISSAARDPKDGIAGYFKQMRKRLELQFSDSGLGYNVEPGTPNGVRPRPGDTVVINCWVTGPDGVTKIPQLSAERMRLKMEELVPGLAEGLQMMTIGNQGLFVVPASLSFGDGPWPEGPPRGAPLIYTVTLLEVVPGDAPH